MCSTNFLTEARDRRDVRAGVCVLMTMVCSPAMTLFILAALRTAMTERPQETSGILINPGLTKDFAKLYLQRILPNFTYKGFCQTLLTNDFAKLYLQMILPNFTYKGFCQTLLTKDFAKLYLQRILPNFTYKGFCQTSLTKDFAKLHLQRILSNFTYKGFCQTSLTRLLTDGRPDLNFRSPMEVLRWTS